MRHRWRKIRTTLTLDAAVMRMVKGRAGREGKEPSQVIEEALRRDLGLALLDKSWAHNRLTEKQAIQVGLEAQHSTRRRRR